MICNDYFIVKFLENFRRIPPTFKLYLHNSYSQNEILYLRMCYILNCCLPLIFVEHKKKIYTTVFVFMFHERYTKLLSGYGVTNPFVGEIIATIMSVLQNKHDPPFCRLYCNAFCPQNPLFQQQYTLFFRFCLLSRIIAKVFTTRNRKRFVNLLGSYALLTFNVNKHFSFIVVITKFLSCRQTQH